MQIYIARHGQTDWNMEHRTQGRTDIPLNATGHAQAKALAEHLSSIPFQAIYVSPLARAYATAQPTAQATGTPLIPDERLIERNFGEWEGKCFCDLKLEYPEIWQQWMEDPYTAEPPRAEPMPELRDRCLSFLKDMTQQYDENDSILVVCHSIPARMLIALITELPLSRLHDIELENADCQALQYPPRKGAGPACR